MCARVCVNYPIIETRHWLEKDAERNKIKFFRNGICYFTTRLNTMIIKRLSSL